MFSPASTRRWLRHPVDMPVSVVFQSGTSTMVAPGRGIELSEGGMALYAGLQLKPFDLVQVEFQYPHHVKVAGIVRNRSGCCFGLEFLSPLPIATGAASNLEEVIVEEQKTAENAITYSLRMRDLYLHEKRVEMQRLKRDLAALKQVTVLLNEMEDEPNPPANSGRKK
jgi:PilZ domain